MKKRPGPLCVFLGLLVDLLSLFGCGGDVAPAPVGCPCVVFQVNGAGHADALAITGLDAHGGDLSSSDAGALDLPIAVRLAIGPTVHLAQLATVRFDAVKGGRIVVSKSIPAAGLPFDDATVRQPVELGDLGK